MLDRSRPRDIDSDPVQALFTDITTQAVLVSSLSDITSAMETDAEDLNTASMSVSDYCGTGLDPLSFTERSQWVDWLGQVLQSGEVETVFTVDLAQKISQLADEDRQCLLEMLGNSYTDLRKLYQGDQLTVLTPRRAVDVILSLLFDPYAYFSTALSEDSASVVDVLDNYYSMVQKTLKFGELSYQVSEISDLVSHLQQDLRSKCALAEKIDRIAREQCTQATPSKQGHRFFGSAVKMFKFLFANRPKEVASFSFHDAIMNRLAALVHKPMQDKQSYLNSAEFRASDFNGYTVVTGSFPQGRCLYRGRNRDELEFDSQQSIGDIDIVPPRPIGGLWRKELLNSDTPWSNHIIGKTIFSTFAGDPGCNIVVDDDSSRILDLYSAISPIAFHIYQDRAKLVVYPFSTTADRNESKPLIVSLDCISA